MSDIINNYGENIAEDVEEFFKIEKDNSKFWKKSYQTKQIKVFRKNIKKKPPIIKGVGVFNYINAQELFDLLFKPQLRTQWDPSVTQMLRFFIENENVDYIYTFSKAPFGFKDRDFCQKRIVLQNVKGTDYIIILKSVDHDQCPVLKNITRTHSLISGYIIRNLGVNRCQLCTISQCDLKVKIY